MTNVEKDINDVFDEIFLSEEQEEQTSYDEGFKKGVESANVEGYHLGYHRGAELGAELGYYLGTIHRHLSLHQQSGNTLYSEKITKQLEKVLQLISSFPRTNSELVDILALAESIRANYKKLCALLKVDTFQSMCTFPSDMLLKKQHIEGQIDSIIEYLDPLLNFANCHMVSFITDDLWTQFVPKDVAREIDENGINESIDYFWKIMESILKNDSSDEKDNRFINLKTFIKTARQHSLRPDGVVCLSAEQFGDTLQSLGITEQTTDNIHDFMSKKKSHEVERISQTVSKIFKATRCTHCLDLGGGKGYLAQHLASQFHHPTFSVDCSEVTLKGASRRRDKLKRVRPAILNKSAPYHHIQQFVNPETDLEKMITWCSPSDIDNTNLRICLTGLHTCGNLGPTSLRLFCTNPAVRSLCNVPCCYHLLKETNSVADESDDVPGFPMSKYLSGLHTCGNLGPTSLRLFCTNPAVRSLCNVPCCYHLLKETNSVADESDDVPGFPMSKYLSERTIGRNARMLASQSLERVVNERKLPELSLHYRAMLQVLIESSSPNAVPETNGKLRKITSKCENFPSYVRCAISKLGLNFILQTDVELETFENEMSIHRERMNIFYILRLCLAQTVESLILLDRLMFLAETGGNDSQWFLVKMFDAIVSPRCYALVAMKDF